MVEVVRGVRRAAADPLARESLPYTAGCLFVGTVLVVTGYPLMAVCAVRLLDWILSCLGLALALLYTDAYLSDALEGSIYASDGSCAVTVTDSTQWLSVQQLIDPIVLSFVLAAIASVVIVKVPNWKTLCLDYVFQKRHVFLKARGSCEGAWCVCCARTTPRGSVACPDPRRPPPPPVYHHTLLACVRGCAVRCSWWWSGCCWTR